jgi:flagellin-like hook-associated protein FlgL
MGYLGLNNDKIHVIDPVSLMKTIDINLKQSTSSTLNSGFVQQEVNDDYNISNVVASKNAAYQYRNYSSINESLNNDLAEYQTAQDNFEGIKGKVGEIKSLLKSAKDGTLTGTALDDAQEEINKLVEGINTLVSTTTVDGKKIFDGKFKQQLQENLSGNTTLTVDFSRAGDVSRPLTNTANLTTTNDHQSTLKVLFADSRYIIAGAQCDANGETTPGLTENGSIQIFDAQTKNLIREIQSPLTGVTNERFGFTASVEGDKILIGMVNYGFWDRTGDGVNDNPVYDRDNAGGAFLYDIPSGNLITSFTKDALAAKNPLVDLGIKSDNDVNPNPLSVNQFSSFGGGVVLKGNSVFISKYRNAGQDNRPGGQGALSGAGVQEFTLDGTFVKQYDGYVEGGLMLTDDYLVIPNSSANGYAGEVSFVDKATGKTRTLVSPNQSAARSFADSAYIQGNQLIVGEGGHRLVGSYDAGGNLTGLQTTEGYVDIATWNSRQNNGGGFNGFGGAVYVYDIDKLMTEYDTAYSAAIAGGQTVSQAEAAGNAAMSSSTSDGLTRTFDKTTLAAQGVSLDTYDGFGYKVKLDGTNAIVQAVWDDSAGVNSSATYVLDTVTGELVAKADGIKYNAAAGDKIYEGDIVATIKEYDFSSVLGAPTTGLNIDTTATKSATLGAKSSRALNNLTVSANVASLGGSQGLVSDQSLVDIDQIESNLTRMEASLNSMVKRVSNSLDRVGDKMNILKDKKSAVDLKLGGYFNASNVNVQIADRRKAVDLLP